MPQPCFLVRKPVHGHMLRYDADRPICHLLMVRLAFDRKSAVDSYILEAIGSKAKEFFRITSLIPGIGEGLILYKSAFILIATGHEVADLEDRLKITLRMSHDFYPVVFSGGR